MTQVRHALCSKTETMIWRKINTRMKCVFVAGEPVLRECRRSVDGGEIIKASKDDRGAQICTWKGMISVMAKIWADGMKS
jgi:hypothetical protein